MALGGELWCAVPPCYAVGLGGGADGPGSRSKVTVSAVRFTPVARYPAALTAWPSGWFSVAYQ
jgi:hypothetical protein